MSNITKDQLAILRDVFEECDDDWLMLHINIRKTYEVGFVLEFDNVNEQDIEALFGIKV